MRKNIFSGIIASKNILIKWKKCAIKYKHTR